MKVLYDKPRCYKLVDNEHDYDFVGYLENLDHRAILVVLFESGESDYDEDSDEIIWDEDDWTVEQIVFAENAEAVEDFREYAELNELEMIEINPDDWGGFLADNRGRSMFNALRKALRK